MPHILQVVTLFLGLAAGNYAWQAITKKNWKVAAERSFFQLSALGALSLSQALQAG